jgi:predicted CoA-binding protein
MHIRPSPPEVKELLQQAKNIAIIGLSDKPTRDSYEVAAYLLKHGYQVIPVNPSLDSVLGQKAYPDLASIPGQIDIVDVFRKKEELPSIIDAALARGCRVIWLQLGLECPEKRSDVAAHGGLLIENQCLMVEHAQLL